MAHLTPMGCDYRGTMQTFSIVGAQVFDGTGTEGEVRDVHVHNGRIVDSLPISGSALVDGRGLAVSPGFIDVHTHDDVAVIVTPLMEFKTLQGVTTVIVGNCGTSIAPDGAQLMGSVGFSRFSEYFERLTENPSATNVAALVGHGSMRAQVMGIKSDREATPDELREMSRLTEEAMQDGAIGMSTGLAYEPGRYSPTNEITHLARIVAEHGGIYTTHMRDEADALVDSVLESIHIGESANIKVQISHLKAIGARNFGSTTRAIASIREAQDRGVDVMADQYPYTRGSTLLDQLASGGRLVALNPNGIHTHESLLVSSAPKHPEWEGCTLRDIATTLQLNDEDTVQHVLSECGRSLLVVIDQMSEHDVCEVMSEDFVMIGSDGVPAGSRPHPRLHHTFPRVLGEYVRKQGLLTLPQAIHKMTGMSATRFGLKDRGFISSGMAADLVLFDPARIIDTGTYVDPSSVPTGIHSVWVNGEIVARDGHATGARPGRPLMSQ